MAVSQDVIRRLTVVAQTKGVDELRAELERLAATQQKTGDAALAVGKKFEALERSYFPLIRAQQKLEKDARTAFNALVQGGADATRAATLLTAATEKFNTVAKQSQTAAQAQAEAVERQKRAFIEEGKAVREAAAAQEHYNRVLGVSSGLSGKSASASAGVFADDARRQKMREQFNPLYGAGQSYRREVEQIREALKVGAISLEEYKVAVQRARAETHRLIFDEMQGGREARLGQSPVNRLSLHQSRNLGFQVNDILTGVMSGQSLPMIAAQQGGQIYQILSDGPGGVGGSIKRLGGYLSGLMTPLRLVLGGFAAIGITAAAAFNSAINRSIAATQALNGIGRASGVTADQLLNIGRSAAGAGGISNISGIQYASQFAGAGISGPLAGSLASSVRRYSQAFGGEENDIASMLAKAFQEPSKGAEELNRRMGFLSAATDLQIKRLEAEGNIQGARNALFKAYDEALRSATIETNGLKEAFHAVKVAASNIWEALGRALTPDSLQKRIDDAAKLRGAPNPFTGSAQGYDGESFASLFRQGMEDAGKRLAEERRIEENRLSFLRLQQERMREDGQLAVATILARTSAEKAAVESQKAYIQTLRETNDQVRAGIAAENARNSAIAEATRALRDHARMVVDEGFMGGARNEREQFMRRMQLEMRDLRERTNILPPDDQWRSQIKYSERAGSLWTGGDGSSSRGLNFGQFPTGISQNYGNSLSALFSAFPMLANGGSNGTAGAASGPRQLTVTRNGFGQTSNAPGAIDQNRLATWDDNKFAQMIHDANVAIEASQRVLAAQRQSFGLSTAEVAKYNEQVRLENDLARIGIPLTEQRRQEIAKTAEQYGAVAAAQERYKETIQTLNDLRSGFSDFGSSLVGAFIRGERGAKLLQAGLNSLLSTVSRMSMNFLMKGLFGNQEFSGGLLSGVLGNLFGLGGGNSFGGTQILPAGLGSGTGGIYAMGGAFSHGREVTAFARGGVVDRPTLFPMAKGAGLMGEAGPEAILPLRRGSDGRLGVSANRGGSGGVTIINENHSSTAKTESREERGPDGRTIIRQIIRDEVGGMWASGEFDASAKARHGISARKVLRG